MDNEESPYASIDDQIALIEYLVNTNDGKIDWQKLPENANMFQVLLSHSTNPVFRSLVAPKQDWYLPLHYDNMHMLKLCQRDDLGGYLVTVNSWGITVLDIDDKIDISILKQRILDSKFNQELFYIHETEKGYHLYLMSKNLPYYSFESVFLRIEFNCDVAYSAYCQYVGTTIRVSKKLGNNYVSRYVDKVGNGHVDHEVFQAYQLIQQYIQEFQDFNPGDLYNLIPNNNTNRWIDKFYQLHQDMLIKKGSDMGLVHVLSVAPLKISNVYIETHKSVNQINELPIHRLNQVPFVSNVQFEHNGSPVKPHLESLPESRIGLDKSSELLRELHSSSIKVTNPTDRNNGPWLIPQTRSSFKLLTEINQLKLADLDLYRQLISSYLRFKTTYRILKSDNSWSLGVHLQQNLYFVSYRHLLMVDYDDKSRLQILASFCRYNPGYVFRITRSTKGYHCFLTSHRIAFNTEESFKLLTRLGCDKLYVLATLARGYSVRINKKEDNEKPYYEFPRVIGKGTELPDLIQDYKVHIKFHNELRNIVDNSDTNYNNIVKLIKIIGASYANLEPDNPDNQDNQDNYVT